MLKTILFAVSILATTIGSSVKATEDTTEFTLIPIVFADQPIIWNLPESLIRAHAKLFETVYPDRKVLDVKEIAVYVGDGNYKISYLIRSIPR